MDKGKLIYRNQSGKFVVYLFFLFAIVFNVNMFLSETKTEFIVFIIFNFFFVLLPFKTLQSIKCNPGFYENGVGYFKNNRCIRFIPYHEFQKIECFVTRRAIKSPDQTPTYGVIFSPSEEDSVEMTFNSVNLLKEKWASILRQNPYLNHQLTILNANETTQKATPPSEERERLATLINQKNYHPASEFLFNTLNQL